MSNSARLKKGASGRRRAKAAMATARVLANFECLRTGSTLRAQNCLRPCWTDFFEPTRIGLIQDSSGLICL